MNLTELMIGDWVSYKGKPHKVNGIGDNHLYLKNSNGCIIMALPDEINSISIIKDILTKNDFDCSDKEIARLDFMDGDYIGHFSLRAMYDKDTGIQHGWAFYAFNVLVILDYVHELQNAMRLCGIKQEIKL